MDNQKSTEGKGSDASQGTGSSIGKSQDINQGKGSESNLGSGASGGSLGSTNASPSSASGATSTSTGAIGGTSNAGSTNAGSTSAGSAMSGSSLGSSAAGSSGSMGSSSMGSSSMSSGGNSGLGTSGSTTGSSSGTAMGSSGGMGGASGSDMNGQKQGGGIKSALSSINPDRMHQSIDKAAQAAQPLVERLVSTAHAGVDRVSGMLGNTKETMGQRSQQLSGKYQDLTTQGREYVRNNPGSAMLAAIGVGYVLAKLLGGSSDSSRDRSYRDYRDY